MKKTITFFSLIVFAMFLTINLNAEQKAIGSSSGGDFQKVAGAGAQFLKVGIGARASGMAGAFTSLADDLSAIHWNPAGISDLKSISADFSYTQWFAGFSHNFAALSLPLGDNFTIAAHIVNLMSDDIEITTTDRPEGRGTFYRVNDMAIGASFGGYLTDQFSFGITARVVQNAFGSLSSSGFSFDVGTMYQTGIQGIKLGFSIHNLGTQMEYSGQELKGSSKLNNAYYSSLIDFQYLSYPYSLPLIFRAGLSSDIYKDETNHLVGAFDFVTLSDSPEQFAFGAEYTWSDLIVARAGYRFGEDQFGFAGGVGIKYTGGGFLGKVDYAITPSHDLGLVNRLSIQLGFGK